ncbi:hypothetical protein [Asticcacaulis taihuensis]|uniref:hypothetical protein n=1 Tax=Asticcacaulis taihuensis TaxID=260084 RepID=UPI0026F2D9E3|nr:hypothetical protein [Asticcacaulis taihuensis]
MTKAKALTPVLKPHPAGHRVNIMDGNTIACQIPASTSRSADQAMAIARRFAANPLLIEALEGAIGALEFNRDYHKDLSNEEQAFAQDKLDAATRALAISKGEPHP